jgi:hypothetical protein
MGLGAAFLSDLIRLKRSGAIDGATRVIEIGAQQISDTMLARVDLLTELYDLFGKAAPFLGKPGSGDFTRDAPPSRDFWTKLGFTYWAIDFGGHRDSVAVDLNRDAVPAEIHGTFDLAVNTGTTEHVANQDNAFRIIHDFTAKRGVMYHEVPSALANHGLINYTNKFFERLCYCNGYRPLFLECDGTMIRTAILKLSDRAFVTPLDLPDDIMPGEPFDLRKAISLVPGATKLIARLRNAQRRAQS